MEKKTKISEETYLKALKALENIDIDKEKYKIIEAPEKYFEPYLNGVEDLPSQNIIHLDIYKIIKKVASRTEDASQKDMAYFLCKYSMIQYTQILRGFYDYSLSIIQNLIEQSSDALLDAYNQNFLNKESLTACMKKMENIYPILKADKEEVEKCLAEMDEMIREIGQRQF